VTFRARPSAALLTLLLALGLAVGPQVAPAQADFQTLCRSYATCSNAGMSASGYAQNNKKMYWLMYSGHNCTNYAAWRLVQSGMPNKRPWSGSGNATNWGVAMSRITDQTPRVGSIAWWRGGTYPAGSAGHVAYVERVVSPTEIVVSQDFWNGDFSWARITKSGRGWPTGFIHFNDEQQRNTADPTVSGAPRVGTTLTANAGGWAPAGPAVRYQWLADGSPVSGATSSSFPLTSAQKDKRIAVRVTATRIGYAAVSAVSAATEPVDSGALRTTARPVISGDPVVGSTLSTTSGSFTPAPDSVRLQWRADGVAIAGANRPTLEVTPGLRGKSLRVVATASRQGVKNLKAASRVFGPVAAELEVVEEPVITGRKRLGDTLTVDPGAVTPRADQSITWLRNGVPVPGATATTYASTEADLGKRIRAVVSHTRAGFRAVERSTRNTTFIRSVPTMTVAATSPRKGRLRVTVGLEAPGVPAPAGVVRIWQGPKMLAEVLVSDGSATKVVTGLKAGKTTYRIRSLRQRAIFGRELTRTVMIR
jgi:surface antigen